MDDIKKILIVEDERSMSDALLFKLISAGFYAASVHNGAEALETLRREPYDLILLDLVMPKMDGFTLLEKMKEEGIDVPVAVFSNLSESEDQLKAKDLGVQDYFLKANTKIADVVEYIRKELVAAKNV